jgi:hypothetical protein
MRTVDSIVREYMIQKGKTSIDNTYPKYLQLAIQSIKDINRQYNEVIKFERIEISQSNFTAPLPVDFVNYIKIAVCYQGQLLALGKNDAMCPPHFDDCGNMEIQGFTQETTDTCVIGWTGSGWWGNWSENGNFLGALYGIGGGNNAIGNFNIQYYDGGGYIAFQNVSLAFDEIILQYIGDAARVNGEYVINEAYEDAVKKGIYYKEIEFLRTYSMGEKDQARKMYNLAKKDAAKQKMSFTMTEVMQAVRAGYKSTPKI